MLAIDSMDGTIKRRMFIRRQTSSFAILLRMHTRGRRFHVSRLAVVVVLLLLLLLLLVALPPHGTDGGHAEGCDLVRRDRRVAAQDLQPGHRQQSAGRQGCRGKLPCLRLLSLLVVLVRVAAHADRRSRMLSSAASVSREAGPATASTRRATTRSSIASRSSAAALQPPPRRRTN